MPAILAFESIAEHHSHPGHLTVVARNSLDGPLLHSRLPTNAGTESRRSAVLIDIEVGAHRVQEGNDVRIEVPPEKLVLSWKPF